MRINHNSLALNASDHFARVNDNIAKSIFINNANLSIIRNIAFMNYKHIHLLG